MGDTALAAAEYRDITSRIFSAAIDPEEWPKVLDDISRLMGGAKMHLFAHDTSARRNLGFVASGHDPEFLRTYVSHFAGLNPYPDFADHFGLGTVKTLESSLTVADIRHTEYYNDWVLPQEQLDTGTGMVLSNDPASLCVVGTMHPAAQADWMDARALEVMTELAPILTKAWRLAGTSAARAFDEGRVAGPVAGEIVAVVETGRRLVHLNGAAERAAAEGTWLRVGLGDRTALACRRADEALGRMLARLDLGGAVPPVSVNVADLDGRGGGRIDLAPFYPDAVSDWASAMRLGLLRPAVMVSITPSPHPGSDDAWASGRGLTATERDVARALSRGLTPAEIAEARGVSIHTIRNQIKQAMAKCDVTRAAQLVALVLSGGDMPGHDE